MSNYATKSDLKKATGADTSKFARKTDVVSLKSDIEKLDVDKLKTVPLDLKKKLYNWNDENRLVTNTALNTK